MYYQITEDADLDALEIEVNGALFQEDDDCSYIQIYLMGVPQ